MAYALPDFICKGVAFVRQLLSSNVNYFACASKFDLFSIKRMGDNLIKIEDQNNGKLKFTLNFNQNIPNKEMKRNCNFNFF